MEKYYKDSYFLSYLDKCNINVTLRQVIIPSLNDNIENINFLKSLKNTYKCIDNIELLPFKKMCESKYNNLNIDFKFKDKNEPDEVLMKKLNDMLN